VTDRKKHKVKAHKNIWCKFRSRFFNYFFRPLIPIEVFEKSHILSFSDYFFSQNKVYVEIYHSPNNIYDVWNQKIFLKC